MRRQLHHFHNPVVRRAAAENNACFLKLPAVIIIDFKTMAVALINQGDIAVKSRGFGSGNQLARIFAEAHGSADLDNVLLLRHQVDDMVPALRIKFRRIGICQPKHIPGVFHQR